MSFVGFQNYPEHFAGNVSHPIKIAESLRIGSTITGPFEIKHTIEGLVKLLMYGDYVQARSSKQSVPYQSIIEEDLKRYSYKRKHNIKVRLDDAHLEQKLTKMF